MARKLYYKILDDGTNGIQPEEWEEISRLEHWYNSEFIWTAGKLALKRFAVFPNLDGHEGEEDALWKNIVDRKMELRKEGHNEEEIVRLLEAANMVIAKKGGYFDGCIASGFTRVAANEWNAYLVCEFLLRCSRIASGAVISVEDEGGFIKTKRIQLSQGTVILKTIDQQNASFCELAATNHHVFSIVDPEKYDRFPTFTSTVAEFNSMDPDERHMVLKDWNWLGFENNYDRNGDDVQGADLNKKVNSFRVGKP